MFKRIKNYYISSFSGLNKDIYFLASVILINRMGTMVIPYLAVYLKTELNMSIIETGLVLYPFGIGAVIGAVSGGFLTDKLGWKKVKVISLIGTAILMIHLAESSNVDIIKLNVLLLAFFIELFRPANAAAITLFSSKDERTKAFGLNRLAINLGMSIGPFIGGFVAYYDYSLIFYIDAMTCLIAAVLLILLFSKQSKSKELKVIENDLKSNLKLSYFAVFVISVLFNAIIFFQIFSTIPIYFTEVMAFNEKNIGMVFLINGLIIVLFEMVLMNYFKHRDLYKGISLGYILTGLSFLFLISANYIGILLFIITLTLGEMLSMPLLSSYISQIINMKRVGVIMGIFVASFSAAHIFAPRIGTLIYELYGPNSLWTALSSLSIINFALISLFNRHRKQIIH